MHCWRQVPRAARLLACALLLAIAASSSTLAAGPAVREVTAPPQDECVRLELDPFYEKYVSAGGLPIVSSGEVSDYALLEAAYLVDSMLAGREDLRQAIIDSRVRLAIMSPTEMTCDIPEHSDLTPRGYWDKRARGLGATDVRPAVSCGEENLLCYEGDPYVGENILVHEFGHVIHQIGLNAVDPTFDARLQEAYEAAMEAGLWEEKYAATNHFEYWAEGVQSYFGTNRDPDHEHNFVNTQQELIEYDPGLAALCHEVFGENEWQYVEPSLREPASSHLAGYDPAAAPTFAWDPGVLRRWDEYQTEQEQLAAPPTE